MQEIVLTIITSLVTLHLMSRVLKYMDLFKKYRLLEDKAEKIIKKYYSYEYDDICDVEEDIEDLKFNLLDIECIRYR